MNITSAQYLQFDSEDKVVKVVTDNQTLFVPINVNNRHYQELQEWVAEGNTIQEAD